MKFENRGHGVHSAFALRSYETTWGETRRHHVAVRTIREGVKSFRVDHCSAVSGVWLPWEPVTNEVFTNRKAASKAARVWARNNRVKGLRT